MRKLMLALAAAGTIGLAATATPVNAGVFTGLTMPEVESNKVDARCWHRRRSSRWRCHRYRRHYYHGPHYYYGPRFYFGAPYYRRYWW